MSGPITIVGAGQIGYGAWKCFGDEGREARVLARSMPSWMADCDGQFERYVVGENPTPEGDVVLDAIAFDAEDIDRYDPDKIGRLIVVSSASVYCDDQGRTLDEAAQNGFPEFTGPITEDQSTVTAGPETYSTRKVRMEQRAIELFGDRATILRPCAIYGPHSRHPREYWFVKRMLDGRKRIPLAVNGTSQFQTSNADLIGDFIVGAVEKDLGGVYNVADTTAPSVLEIGQSTAKIMGISPEFDPLEGYPEGTIGRTPWSVPLPFIVDGSKAMRDANLARVTYNVEVEDCVRWLIERNPEDWRTAFPHMTVYPWDLFDYGAEDAYLASLDRR